jgi:hypothetical protein
MGYRMSLHIEGHFSLLSSIFISKKWYELTDGTNRIGRTLRLKRVDQFYKV